MANALTTKDPRRVSQELIDWLSSPEGELELLENEMSSWETEDMIRKAQTLETEKLPLVHRPMGPSDGSRDWNAYFSREQRRERVRKRVEELRLAIREKRRTPA